MIKFFIVLLQTVCFLGALLFFKLVNYVPISNAVVYGVLALIVAYPLLLKWLYGKQYKGINVAEQIKYILLPLLGAEVVMVICYRQEIYSLFKEFLRINGLS